jgi:hypothetical protein
MKPESSLPYSEKPSIQNLKKWNKITKSLCTHNYDRTNKFNSRATAEPKAPSLLLNNSENIDIFSLFLLWANSGNFT